MKNNTNMKVGFIGLGLMGQQMANQILDNKFDLTVWNRTASKAESLLDQGAKWADSPAELAKNSDVIITMVTNSKAVESVITGENGVLSGANKGLIIIDMSSINPEKSRELSGIIEEAGCSMLDAPVTGNPNVASRGALGIMIGGPEDIYQRVLPIFEAMAAKIVYVGKENGFGTTLKLINNLILGASIMASAEALVLAKKAGINPERVIEITSVGGARTGAMETRGQRMVEKDFSAHFSANNMYKDLSSAVGLADELKVTLPVANLSKEFLKPVLAKGKGDLDSCIVIEVLEELAAINK